MEIVVIENGFVLCFSGAHGPTFFAENLREEERKKVPEAETCVYNHHLGVVQCAGWFSESL